MILSTPPQGKRDVTVRFSNTDTKKCPPTTTVPVAVLLCKCSNATVQILYLHFRTLSPSMRFVQVDKYVYIVNIKDIKMRYMLQYNVLTTSKLTVLWESSSE